MSMYGKEAKLELGKIATIIRKKDSSVFRCPRARSAIFTGLHQKYETKTIPAPQPSTAKSFKKQEGKPTIRLSIVDNGSLASTVRSSDDVTVGCHPGQRRGANERSIGVEGGRHHR
jgi:hypothetical protein